MNSVLLLAGPPAVGHNTVAERLAEQLGQVAIVDGDDLRAMITEPPMPGAGEQWQRWYELSIRTMCSIAVNLNGAGVGVILLDVVEPATVPLFRGLLAEVSRLDLVLLTADTETLLARDRARDPDPDPDPVALATWHARIAQLRAQLEAESALYDHRIDTTGQPPEETVAAVLRAVSPSGTDRTGARWDR